MRILKAPMLTIGVISIAFVPLQRIPCLVVKAYLLIYAARGRPASMTGIQVRSRWISSPGKTLIIRAIPRR